MPLILNPLDIEILKDAKGDFSDAAAPINNRHGGYIAYDDKVVGETKQCPHCQAHFVYRKGSGTVRHICPYCESRSTCGRAACHPNFCGKGGVLYWERQMDAIEAADRRRREVEGWLSTK